MSIQASFVLFSFSLGVLAPDGHDADAAFEAATVRAKELAGSPYEEPRPDTPEFLRQLSYDDYRKITFRNDRVLWAGEDGLRFRLLWHHVGSLFELPVTLHVVDGETTETIVYDPSAFDFGDLSPPELPPSTGLAGVRLLFPLNRPDHFDEVVSFLGASYFRMVGAGQGYGLSARGLAIDTASEDGEEFPRFSVLWIEKPGPRQRRVELVALLESRRVTGAYRFSIEPGTETEIAVEARLFFRDDVGELGLAPLASMFHFGENRERWTPDYRPEVHDSDGLLVATGEGITWRPLQNPTGSHRITRFPTTDLWGFGLMQRDRDPEHYCDLESRYDRRPSLWIEPERGFGAGAVELVEIPSDAEWNDNVVASFVPDREVAPGAPLELAYRLRTVREEALFPGLARVRATRLDPGDGERPVRFLVEFEAGAPPFATRAVVQPRATGSRGEIRDLRVERSTSFDGWTVSFRLEPGDAGPHELELVLRSGDRIVSERWSYKWMQR